jgi:AAA+ superfamily predicted ATPase
MSRRIPLTILGSAEQQRLVAGYPGDLPLTDALARAGCRLAEPLSPDHGTLRLCAFQLNWIEQAPPRKESPAVPATPAPDRPRRPANLSYEDATQLAYSRQVDEVAAFLRADLSVLVICEKAVVRYLTEHMVRTANRQPVVIQASPADAAADTAADSGARQMALFAPPSSLGQREMAQLRDELRALKDGQVLVIPHLDLLAGGADGFAPAATDVREMTELLYGSPEAVILAFADPSLTIPEVLAARFSRRLAIEGSDRTIAAPDGTIVPLERALITEQEAACFRGIDDTDFYKHVAGLNPVRIRQAMRYAMLVHEGKPQPTAHDLHDTIRTFKAHLATGFQIPKVTFAQIGGYEDVKRELLEALRIMAEVQYLPDEDRELKSTLVPRGFIFHGPPGTGKTLFAKAVASEMRGTIQVVSGPEVTSKWVGEGERKVRDLFAEARRNSPSVIVFDEFDSIAARRSSGMDDGGSRAANAMVAQILTEMDGFRPDVPMIVIGTTNRLDIIDKALLRPSRFRSFHIGLPDLEARKQIIRVHARDHHIEIGDDIVEAVALGTKDWNGDELRSLFRDAYVAKWIRHVPVNDTTDLVELLAALAGEIQKSRQGQHESSRGH